VFLCYWVPVTTHPWVADGGDSLQTWRMAANILNKQLWTADKEWSSGLGVGQGANISSPYKTGMLQNVIWGLDIFFGTTKASGLGWGPVAGSCEHSNEPSDSAP
jgi:hypothetical protein